ncbi:MAG: L-threonylcarbamoyladenylate synthase [Gemmatimonadota bacterium]
MLTRTVGVDDLDAMVATLEADQVVALPTETVYGLAARAVSRRAVERIFQVKGRPADNPLIVHAASAEAALALCTDVPGYVPRLAASFWPGPLTLVLPSGVAWPWVQAGHDTLGVRVPRPAYLRQLLRRVGPLAAPSANRSGRPSPTTAAHCLADLQGLIPLVVDGGPCAGGMESTVLDCTGPDPAILRPGPVTRDDVRRVLGSPGTGTPDAPPRPAPASPGTRHPHYRPRARVVLADDAAEVTEPDAMTIAPVLTGVRHPRRYADVEELARNLYAWFREADALGVATIYVQRVPETGLGAAVMNRLHKAAAPDG